MIVIDFCRLDRHANGREYVMVRLSMGEPPMRCGERQVTKEYWERFIGVFKPARSMLEVNEIPLQEWG